jgi:hypothetical protein
VAEPAEFGVTEDGELDLGVPAAAGPAATPRAGGPEVRRPILPAPGEDDWPDLEPEPFEPDFDGSDPEDDPDDFGAWLAGLPAEVREDFLAGPFTGEEGPVPAGFLHHERGGPSGLGFASGGVLDTAGPDWWLARALQAVTAGGYDQLGESELIGVLCASRRMASWAAAGEAAAVITLAKRRAAQSACPGSSRLAGHVVDEIAAALTLTGRSAARLLEVAAGLARLPGVHAALARGEVDWPKACVFADELAVLADDAVAAGIAARFLGRAGAGGWTTGQLRAALRRAVLAADPDAAGRRQAQARQDAAVHAFGEGSGNAGLAGRELPPAEVLAADARLTALAKWLHRRGAPGTISQLRAAVYTALLNGRPITTLLDNPAPEGTPAPGTSAPGDAGPGHTTAPGTTTTHAPGTVDGADSAAGDGAGAAMTECPPVSGTIHLTMPLSALAGGGEPSEVAGHGPVDAATSRQLAAMLAASAGTRWCLTVTGHDGRAAGHACARTGPGGNQPVIAWAAGLRARLQLIETGTCRHHREASGYTPPKSLRHLIGTRQRTCAFPGCRRPATRCDLDHTIPHDQGGRTCQCNLAPLCRAHHQAKQAPGWHLEQPEPGQMTWRLPSSRVYQTTGDPY